MSEQMKIIYPHGAFLADRAANAFSQFGEDGLIAAVFERIGERNRWCFEVGAHDGRWLSNTLRLRQAGWSAVLIEADEEQFAKLKSHARENVFPVHDRIGPDSLDRVLAAHGAPADLDLGVIDIDGQDYWAWQGMTAFRPRVMLVEYSPYGTVEDFPGLGEEGQAGINPILRLGAEKEYIPLAVTICNVLFVRADAFTTGERSE